MHSNTFLQMQAIQYARDHGPFKRGAGLADDEGLAKRRRLAHTVEEEELQQMNKRVQDRKAQMREAFGSVEGGSEQERQLEGAKPMHHRAVKEREFDELFKVLETMSKQEEAQRRMSKITSLSVDVVECLSVCDLLPRSLPGPLSSLRVPVGRFSS